MKLGKYLYVPLVTILLISIIAWPVQVEADDDGTTNAHSNLKDKIEGIPVTEAELRGLETTTPVSYTVKLGSGWFTPSPGIQVDMLESKITDTDHVYCLIQFYRGKYTLDDYDYLKESGVKVLSYVPDNTYYAKVPLSWLDTPPSFVRWIGTLNPEQKIDPSLFDKLTLKSSDKFKVIINFFEALSNEELDILKSYADNCNIPPGCTSIAIFVNKTEVLEFAKLNCVKWITPQYNPHLCLDRSVNLISADYVWASGNTGSGVTVGVIDTGILHNHPHFDDITIYDSYDYVDNEDGGGSSSSNVCEAEDDPNTCFDDHGVHCAGIVSGEGTYDNRALRGTSWKSNLLIMRIFGPDGGDLGCAPDWYYDVNDNLVEMWEYISDPDHDGDYTEPSSADVVSCSWGASPYGDYTSWAETTDRAVRGDFGKELTICFAVANDGENLNVANPATAKNVISVGACADYRSPDGFCGHGWTRYDEDNLYVMDYSQRGTSDNRVKPDILAPGSDITSAVFDNTYDSWDGTSMATPHVAAVAAQILHEYPDASPALVKAFIISSAVDGGTTDAPSIDRAWGRLNAYSSVYKLPDEAVDSYDENTVGNLLSLQPRERYYTINVPNDAAKLIVTLVYSDDPADPSGDQTAPKLVNDLDLFLVDPSGNELYRNDDAVNNVEKYVIDNPEAGNWEAHVRVVDLADLGGLLPKSQDYAIAIIVIKESEEPSTSITPHHNVTLCTSTNDNMMVAVGDCFEVWCNVSCKGLSCYNVFCNVTGPTEGMTLLSDEFDGSGEEYDLLGDIPVGVSRSSRHWIYRADTIGKYKINISMYGERADGSEIHNSTNITVNVVTKQRFVIEKGLCWLRSRQNTDGSWQHNVGITSLAGLAFLNAGYNESDKTVAKAIKYVTNHVQSDGSIYGDYDHRTYETSLAILALVATHNESYKPIIENAMKWLLDSQWDENCLWGSVDKNNWYYGGFGYGRNIRPDLSNTQFALMALDAAGVPKDDPVWAKAQVFLARCQNRQADVYIPELNYTVHWNPTYNKYDDGGFVYHPGRSLAGDVKSYGSMTGAGIWCLKLCGVNNTDPRLQAALNWTKNHYTWEGNPGMPDPTSMQYYYYLSMSKALLMCTYPGYELDGHYWYDDLCKKLIDLQKPDGYWVNTNSRAWEDVPELVTSYSLLSLETRIPIPEEIKRLSYITFILHSNADLHIYDPLGRHVGINYTTGEIEIQIPNATYYKNDIQKITVPNLESGDYRIILIGTGTGEYNLTIRGTYKNETIYERSYIRNISEGEVHDATVNVAMITGLSIHLTEPPEPTLKTDLTNVELVSLDPTVTSINVTRLNLSEINETYKPEECITLQSAYMINSTGAGNFTLRFTDIPNANTITVYKIDPTSVPPNQWIELDATTTADTVTFTMSVEDPPIVFCSGAPPARVPTLTPIGITALAGGLLVIGIRKIKKRK
ncbi:MAG: S8 family serine peptidase [Canidatus Methanoxibalbensis ujae]|nr:S8 family serine peptidase [Candidatus Methanoxibalbensis ujae]